MKGIYNSFSAVSKYKCLCECVLVVRIVNRCVGFPLASQNIKERNTECHFKPLSFLYSLF